MTVTRKRSLSTHNRTRLERWVCHYDHWLHDNLVTTAEAAAYAREDGLAFATRNRVALIGGRQCEWWLHRYGKRLRRRRKERNLSARAWGRLTDMIRKKSTEVQGCHSVSQVALLLAYARRRYTVGQVAEALKAMSINLPVRTERPRYNKTEEQDGQREQDDPARQHHAGSGDDAAPGRQLGL